MTREEIGNQIVNWEARRDKQGRLKVYQLPSGDGGGKEEVAGINSRYHPVAVRHLKMLIDMGRYEEAEREASNYIISDTDSTGRLAGDWRTELFLRDTAFNRGPTGAAKILQHSLKVAIDGKVGAKTLTALRDGEKDAPRLIKALRNSREWYERSVVGRNEGSKFWRGLVNRWDKVTAEALA